MTPTSPGSDTPPEENLHGLGVFTEVKDLSPAYFGMVMATGIVALAGNMLGIEGIAQTLFQISLAAYGGLWLLTLARMLFYPQDFFSDLIDHLRGPGFFTIVAATCILGSEFLVFLGSVVAGLAFWFVAIAFWIALTYAIFTAFTIKEHKPGLDQGISGSWLLAVVATQSIAVLGAMLAARVGEPYAQLLNFVAFSMLLWGGMLYIWLISLIFYRYTFFRFSPDDLLPPYWINMGAMAISTLAGSLLILNSAKSSFLLSLLPFLKGFTLLYWITGTWWIPMLLILGVWRHVYRRFPLRYDPLYWSIVFPLGMYAASTHEMIKAMALDFLRFLPMVFVYIALASWCVALAGLMVDVIHRIFKHEEPGPERLRP